MSHHVRVYEQGPPSVLRYEETEVGDPAPTQVRLRHKAIGVNFVDTMFRDGKIKVPLPFDVGVEAAGVIEAVGAEVSGLKIGDRVAYWFAFGSYSDVRLVEASLLVKLPDSVSSEVAAAVFAKGFTAWALLMHAHVVKPGEFVLVHGAAGGVGSLLVSWASSLGATVIATVGSSEKVSSVRQGGIEHVFDSNERDLVSKIRAITGGHGVDVVYELVGAATFATSVAALRDGGDLIHPGSASGAPSVDQAELSSRSIHYSKPSTGQFIKDRTSLDEAADALFKALKAGVFGEIHITRYPLANVRQAHEDLSARRIVGSAILVPGVD